jgi:hypothetical protein
VEYVHAGDPVDVTFGVKELKVMYDPSFALVTGNGLKYSVPLIESENSFVESARNYGKTMFVCVSICITFSTPYYCEYKKHSSKVKTPLTAILDCRFLLARSLLVLMDMFGCVA